MLTAFIKRDSGKKTVLTGECKIEKNKNFRNPKLKTNLKKRIKKKIKKEN